MYDCFIMIFTALSGLGAVGAIITAIRIYHRQERIALFDRRAKTLDDFEKFVFEILPCWGWQGEMKHITKYSEQEVVALFNEEYGKLRNNIIQTAEKCNILIGDIEYAQNHGTCHNKTEVELENEKKALEKGLQSQFSLKRGEAYQKWLKI